MKEPIVICGGGPHSKVVIDLILDADEYSIAGVVDRTGEAPFGLKCLGTDDDLPAVFSSGITKAFVAIGNNHVRKTVTEKLTGIGFTLINVIAPDSIISQHANIGSGVLINHGAIINVGTEIGDGSIINTGATVDHDCRIGKFCHIAPGAHISGTTKVGEQTFIGVGSCVKDYITIGCNVMIGAGAAVVHDIPSDCTAVGVPAKVIKTVTQKK